MSFAAVKEEITHLLSKAGEGESKKDIIDRALGAYAPLYHSTEAGETAESEWDVRVEAVRDWEHMKQHNQKDL